MQSNVNVIATAIPKAHAPSANQDAVITLSASSGEKHVLDKVFGGYSSDPGALKLLTIEMTVLGTAVTLTYPVGLAFDLNFDPPLQGDDNTAITITLPAGGDGISGKLNAVTR